MRLTIFGAVLALTLPAALAAQPAAAPAPAPAAPAPPAADDAARRSEAHAIIAIMFPVATRERTMNKMMTELNAVMLQGLDLPSISDAGLKSIFDRFVARVQAQSTATVQAALPRQLAAMEGAYARNFTLAQLKDVHAFAETPSGQLYLQRSLDLVSDPEVRAATLATMTDGRAKSQAMVKEFAAEVAAYVQAHPDAANELARDRKS